MTTSFMRCIRFQDVGRTWCHTDRFYAADGVYPSSADVASHGHIEKFKGKMASREIEHGNGIDAQMISKLV